MRDSASRSRSIYRNREVDTTVRSIAIDTHNEDIILILCAVSDVEGERQMTAFMCAKSFAIQPDFREVSDGIETNENTLSAPCPRERESRLIPCCAEIVTPFVELIIPTGRDSDDLTAVKTCLKTTLILLIKLNFPETR